MNTQSSTPSSFSSHRWRLYAALMAVLGAALAGAAWAEQPLGAMGGPGGGAFTARCPQGELLAGFELRAADDVDAIRPLCVTAYGPTSISTASDSAWHGGDGGSPTYVVCPQRTTPIVTGMYVNFEGARTVIINSIHLFCDVAGDAQLASPYTVVAFDGPAWDDNDGFFVGDPNFNSGTQRCPVGQVAVGMHGRSGTWVDAIGLICGEPRIGKAIAKVGAGPARPAGWTICDSAREARGRESPAALALEAQCAAYEATGKAMAKVPIPKDNGQLPMSICDRARDARARNSPVAARLAEQCLASGGKL